MLLFCILPIAAGLPKFWASGPLRMYEQLDVGPTKTSLHSEILDERFQASGRANMSRNAVTREQLSNSEP